MPNHVYTTMQVLGTEKEVQDFFMTHFTESEGGDSSFDFNTFIKMPEELAGTRSPVQESDSVENVQLREVYGADNWYDWNVANWGTKWNSYDNYIGEDNTVSFQTAWSLPVPIFEKMAALYPTMTFLIQTVEEGGYFSGDINIVGGEIIDNLTDDSDKWKDYAFELMGWEFDEDE